MSSTQAQQEVQRLQEIIVSQAGQLMKQQRELQNQQKEIEELRDKASSTAGPSCRDDTSTASAENADSIISISHADNDESLDTVPRAIRDCNDSTLRCSDCTWEIVDRFCQNCGLEHGVYADSDTDENMTGSANTWITSTYFDMLNSDRQLAPRGSTPGRALPVDESFSIPEEYLAEGKGSMYLELLRRGATPSMCTTFKLEFNPDYGIIAYGDDALVEEFHGSRKGSSVSKMEPGDLWKIHLGRCLNLGNEDEDGAQFMVELIEEAVVYTLTDDAELGRWETVLQVEPGPTRVWITRPSTHTWDRGGEAKTDYDVACGDFYADDYEDWEPEDDSDEREVDPDWVPGTTDERWGDFLSNEEPIEDGVEIAEATEDKSDDSDQSTAMDVEDDSSSPGSDWDSNEELSGDEEALRDAPRIMALTERFF